MNQRERLFAFFNNEPIDRVPIWLLFPYHKIGCYVDVHSLPCYRAVVDCALENAVWLDRRSPGVPLYEPEVKTWTEEETSGDVHIVRKVIAYKDCRLTHETRNSSGGKSIKRYLSSEDDLDMFMSLPLVIEEDAIRRALAPKAAALRQDAAEFPGHLGAIMLSLGEPIGVVYGMTDYTELPVWSLTAPDKVQKLLDKLMIRYRHIYRCLLEQDVGEVFFFVGLFHMRKS